MWLLQEQFHHWAVCVVARTVSPLCNVSLVTWTVSPLGSVCCRKNCFTTVQCVPCYVNSFTTVQCVPCYMKFHHCAVCALLHEVSPLCNVCHVTWSLTTVQCVPCYMKFHHCAVCLVTWSFTTVQCVPCYMKSYHCEMCALLQAMRQASAKSASSCGPLLSSRVERKWHASLVPLIGSVIIAFCHSVWTENHCQPQCPYTPWTFGCHRSVTGQLDVCVVIKAKFWKVLLRILFYLCDVGWPFWCSGNFTIACLQKRLGKLRLCEVWCWHACTCMKWFGIVFWIVMILL